MNESYITDLGEDFQLEDGSYPLQRYGYWEYNSGKGKMQVKEISDNLTYLMEKYKITSNNVYVIPKKR